MGSIEVEREGAKVVLILRDSVNKEDFVKARMTEREAMTLVGKVMRVCGKEMVIDAANLS